MLYKKCIAASVVASSISSLSRTNFEFIVQKFALMFLNNINGETTVTLCAAGEVTAGLVKSSGSLRPCMRMTHVSCGLTAQNGERKAPMR